MLRRATRRSGAACHFRTISDNSGAARRGGLMHPTSRPSGCASCSRCHRSGTELRSGLVQSPPPRRARRMRRRDHSNRPVHGSEPFHHAGASAAALQMSCSCSETLPGQPGSGLGHAQRHSRSAARRSHSRPYPVLAHRFDFSAATGSAPSERIRSCRYCGTGKACRAPPSAGSAARRATPQT